MPTSTNTKIRKILLSAGVVSVAFGLSFDAHSSNSYKKNHSPVKNVRDIKSVSVTGTNRLFGQPVYHLGTLGPAGSEFIFAHNPDGEDPLPLTIESPADTILVNGINEGWNFAFNIPPEAVDRSMKNIPIRQVPYQVTYFGEKASLKPISELAFDKTGLAGSGDPVTLEQWLSAKAEARFTCFEDGTSTVDIRYKNLVPISLYTMWLAVGLDQNSDGVVDGIDATPLGGAPSVFMSNKYGTGRFIRDLNFCPEDQERALFVHAALHSDGTIYGAVIVDQENPAGTTSHTQLMFPLSVSEF